MWVADSAMTRQCSWSTTQVDGNRPRCRPRESGGAPPAGSGLADAQKCAHRPEWGWVSRARHSHRNVPTPALRDRHLHRRRRDGPHVQRRHGHRGPGGERLLGFTSLVCTPYRGEDQSVSGVLTFALVAGCPVVSTPFRYAVALLADGAGWTAPADDVDGFAVVQALHGVARIEDGYCVDDVARMLPSVNLLA